MKLRKDLAGAAARLLCVLVIVDGDDVLLIRKCGSQILRLCVDIADQELESLSNVGSIEGRDSEPLDETIFLTIIIEGTLVNSTAVKVYLVSKQNTRNRFVSVGESHFLVKVGLPLGHVFEGRTARYVVDHECRKCVFVIHTSHIAETFLASDIPKLEANRGVVIQIHTADSKINANLMLYIINIP